MSFCHFSEIKNLTVERSTQLIEINLKLETDFFFHFNVPYMK